MFSSPCKASITMECVSGDCSSSSCLCMCVCVCVCVCVCSRYKGVWDGAECAKAGPDREEEGAAEGGVRDEP